MNHANSSPLELITPLNPMVFYARFQHILEEIFEKMDVKCLKNFKKVSKVWQECIDSFVWNKIIKSKDSDKVFQWACENGLITPLNPMVFHARFQHISEGIFEKMDVKSLKNFRQVSKLWQECIDDILWNKIIKIEDSNKAFQWACENGLPKMAKVLIQKSKEFKVDVNMKDELDKTPFHHACIHGYFEIVELMFQKSTEFKIDLNAKDNCQMTGLHHACNHGCTKIAEMLIQKSADFNIDLNACLKADDLNG